MKLLIFTAALALGLLTPQSPSLENILERVSGNVQELQTELPDYFCNERLVKTPGPRMRLAETHTTQGIVRAVRTARGSLQVSREIQSVPGKTTAAELIGMQIEDLVRVFAKDSLVINNYKLAGQQDFRKIPAFVIEFATKEGQTAGHRGGVLSQNGDPAHTFSGKAWIARDSMQVMRLEFVEKFPPAKSGPTIKTVADYNPVNIGGAQYWLLTKIVKTDTGGFEWLGEYSNCRKYEVSTQIKPIP
jgi:hypothetical protein